MLTINHVFDQNLQDPQLLPCYIQTINTWSLICDKHQTKNLFGIDQHLWFLLNLYQFKIYILNVDFKKNFKLFFNILNCVLSTLSSYYLALLGFRISKFRKLLKIMFIKS
jgi:hypothetical protein